MQLVGRMWHSKWGKIKMWGRPEVSPRSCSLYQLGEPSRNESRWVSVLSENMVENFPRSHINSFSVSISSEGRVELLGGGSLQISNLTEEDAGVYTCMADNANGSIEAQAQLAVQGTLQTGERLNAELQTEEEFTCSVLKRRFSNKWAAFKSAADLNCRMCVCRYEMLAALSHSLTSCRNK